MTDTILDVSGLEVSFDIGGEPAVAVDRLGFSLRGGETLGIVGESGSGKSMAALAVMGLIPSPPGSVSGGSIRFRGRELVGMDEEERRRIRGKDIAMIFQEPMTALNPVFTVGDQIAETLMLHEGLERRAAWERAEGLLAEVGIPEPAIRVRNYPFELSGGMRQRVMIAIALACDPDILICDEPTTALDVTIQLKILNLIKKIQKEKQISVVYITHDLGVVAKVADYVCVMYAGRIIEKGSVEEIFYDPRHPYTWGLLSSMPDLTTDSPRLFAIPGEPVNLLHEIKGDAFAPRNPYVLKIDFEQAPPMFNVGGKHRVASWLCHPKAEKVQMPESLRIKIDRMLRGVG